MFSLAKFTDPLRLAFVVQNEVFGTKASDCAIIAVHDLGVYTNERDVTAEHDIPVCS